MSGLRWVNKDGEDHAKVGGTRCSVLRAERGGFDAQVELWWGDCVTQTFNTKEEASAYCAGVVCGLELIGEESE